MSIAAALACSALLTGCPNKKSDSPPAEQRTEPKPSAVTTGDADTLAPAAHDAAPQPMNPAEYCKAILPIAEAAKAIEAHALTVREPTGLPPSGMIECHLQAQSEAGWIAHSIDLFVDCRPQRPSMTTLRARAEQLVQNGGQLRDIELGTKAVVAESVLLDQPSTTIMFHHASRPCAVTLTGSFGAADAVAELARQVHQAMADTPLP